MTLSLICACLNSTLSAVAPRRSRARCTRLRRLKHALRNFAISSVHQYAGWRRLLFPLHGMEASHALTIVVVNLLTWASACSRPDIPFSSSPRDTLSSCTSRSLFNRWVFHRGNGLLAWSLTTLSKTNRKRDVLVINACLFFQNLPTANPRYQLLRCERDVGDGFVEPRASVGSD